MHTYLNGRCNMYAFEKHRYANPVIQNALEEARPSILFIISSTMKEQHPILQDYANWSRKHKGILESFRNSCFSYDLLPGDASLSGEAAVHFSQTLPTDTMPGLDMSRAWKNLPIVHILFDLVVLRVYLGRPATDDAQIYYLARKYNEDELKLLNGMRTQSAPSSKINIAPPPVPPPIPAKMDYNEQMDVDASPSDHYNLQKNPFSSRLRNALSGLKRKREEESRDSWDDPNFLESQRDSETRIKDFDQVVETLIEDDMSPQTKINAQRKKQAKGKYKLGKK